LALDTTGIVPYPVDIDYEFTSGIKKIESKSDFNIVVLSNGELYSWGSNMFNRLGLNQIRK
jgi:alpha-tubulin suppressor-like RCC1 family protein